MRRSTAALAALALFIASWIAGELMDIPVLDNLAFTTLVAVALIVAYHYLRFEEKKSDTKIIAVIGTLAALSVAGRVLMAPVPNVQPSTFIIAVSGYVFGPLEGFMVGSTTALVSNIFLGHGPWTLWQMLAWGLVGLVSGFLGKRELLEGRLGLGLYCAAWGLLYGWLVNFYFILGYVKPLTAASFLTAYAAGFWFDFFHAAGNFVFAFALGPALVAMLKRYAARFSFSSSPEHAPAAGAPRSSSTMVT